MVNLRDDAVNNCFKVGFCSDINECERNNGNCEQICINSQGSYRCACETGFDLLVEDGQGGVHVKVSLRLH